MPAPPMLFADARRLQGQPLDPPTLPQVRAVLADPGGLEVDLDGFSRAYEDWADAPHDEAARPEWMQFATRDSTLAWIKDQGAAGRLIRFNCVWRNAKGLRRHYLHLDAPRRGGLLRRAPKKGTGRWLQNIPKCIRKVGLRAPEGRVLVQVDIKSAFPTLMGHAAGDAVLLQDVGGDFHDDVATALGIPRAVAKVINNGLVGLMGPEELHKQFLKAGLDATEEQAKSWHRAWWSRYAASRQLIAVLRERWKQAVSKDPRGLAYGLYPMVVIAPDGQQIRYSPAEVAGAPLPHGVRRGFPSMVSAVWQSIEATATDLAILDLHQHRDTIGLKLVLGTYDGLLYSAPVEHADEAEQLVGRAVETATSHLGYGARVETLSHEYWWSPDQ